MAFQTLSHQCHFDLQLQSLSSLGHPSPGVSRMWFLLGVPWPLGSLGASEHLLSFQMSGKNSNGKNKTVHGEGRAVLEPLGQDQPLLDPQSSQCWLLVRQGR
jgi:hypothetical protein